MNKSFYHSYTSAYDNPLLRGKEEPRPWNFLEIVKEYAGAGKTLLDIGCGTAAKVVQLSPYFGKVIGIEPNPHMLEEAKKRVTHEQHSHIHLEEGFAHRLPVENSTIDVLTVMMSALEIVEIYRALKPNGVVVIEMPGEQDKKALKDFFIDLNEQPRGQYSFLPKESIKNLYNTLFENLFKDIIVREGFWDAYLTEEGLLELLTQTPTIRNFDKSKDKTQVEKAIKYLQTDMGIKVTHHRVLIIARK